MAMALTRFDLAQWQQNPLGLVLYGLVLVGGALLGGLLVGLIGRYTALLFWKELSTRTVLLLRLVGGIGGAVAAFSLIGDGSGFGFGPGPGGLPGGGKGTGDAVSLADQSPSSTDPASATKTPVVVRIVMLGGDTKPPYEEPDRFFAFVEQPGERPLDIPEVLERLRTLQGQRPVKEVELVVSEGTSLFGVKHVPLLRDRIIRELRVPFSQPDFSGNPLKDRSRYEPPK
jgi:hypothetical protein